MYKIDLHKAKLAPQVAPSSATGLRMAWPAARKPRPRAAGEEGWGGREDSSRGRKKTRRRVVRATGHGLRPPPSGMTNEDEPRASRKNLGAERSDG